MADKDFYHQLTGSSLTTAEILYHMPDHPGLLQTYVWQSYDLHPHFPKLLGFLQYWTRNLDGALHQIRVAHSKLIKPVEFRMVGKSFRLH